MNREELKAHLEAGGAVCYSAWRFTKGWMSCWEEGCCETDMSGADEVLDYIESVLSYGNTWGDVHVEDY